MRHLALGLTLLVLFACGKAEDKIEPADPSDQVVSLWTATADRLVPMLDHGFVVSRYGKQNEIKHQGDALIWSGLALGALPCRVAAPVSAALRAMIDKQAGGFYRHPSLPTEVSMDGALGLYKGVAALITHCPAELADWTDALAKHQAFVSEHGDTALNAASPAELVPEFTAVRDQLFHQVGLDGQPASGRIRTLEKEISAWVLAVKTTKKSCFRVHLGLLSFQALESMGVSISAGGRDAFCGLTKGMDMPTVDNWCGRGDLTNWVAGFQFDAWEYRHQRCGAWESPDGKGYRTPAIDLLEGIAQAYKLNFGE